MSKEMMISTSPHETKVALVEEGQVVEVYLEREKEYGLVGSIYKGRVSRVLPGMQSAFVDIGLDRDAFLYVSDFFEGLDEYDVSTPTPPKEPPQPEPPAEPEASAATGEEKSEPASPEPPQEESQKAFVHDEPPLVLPERKPEGRSHRGGRRRRRGHRSRPGDRREQPGFQRPRVTGRPHRRPPEPAPEANAEEVTVLPGESLAKYSRPAMPGTTEAEPSLDQIPASSPELRDSSDGAPLEGPPREDAQQFQPDSDIPAPEATDDEPLLSSNPAPEVGENAQASPERPREGEDSALSDPPPAVEVSASAVQEDHSSEGSTSSVISAEIPAGEEAPPESLEETLPGDEDQAISSPLPSSVASPESFTDEVTPAEPPAEPQPADKTQAESALVGDTPPAAEEQPGEGPNEHYPEAETLADIERVRRYEGEVGLPPSVQERTEDGVEWGSTSRPPTEPRGRGRRGARGYRRPGRGQGRERPQRRAMGRPRRGPGRPARRTTARPSRGQPAIAELLRPGQEIIVQIAKEQIGRKGARITSHVTLPGRFIVYMPSIEHVGISRKIESAAERTRLRRILMELKGSMTGGFVVRTAATGCSEEDLRRDVDYLVKLWHDLRARSEERPSPSLLHRDLNVIDRILRDQLTTDYQNIWIDNEEEYAKVVEFVGKFQPELVSRAKLYTKENPLFEEMGVQSEIDRALRPKVWLKSGGYIVINHTEALVAIDVNTGKYVGKGSTRLEDTIVKTNLEAIKEIVRQIRLRDLGGIIIIDFIDMEDRRNRRRVMQALEEALRADRSPSKTLSFNEFGLVAITRKRSRQSLERLLCQPCIYCSGTGMVKSIPTLCTEIQGEAKKMAAEMDAPELTIRAHPEIVKSLKGREAALIKELEEQTDKNIILKPDTTMHFEQYNIY